MPNPKRSNLSNDIRYMILSKPHTSNELVACFPDAGVSSVHTLISNLFKRGEIARADPAIRWGARWVPTAKLRDWAAKRIVPIEVTPIRRPGARPWPEIQLERNGTRVTLLTQSAAAKHFGVQKGTINALIRRGKLKTYIIPVPTQFVIKEQAYRPGHGPRVVRAPAPGPA